MSACQLTVIGINYQCLLIVTFLQQAMCQWPRALIRSGLESLGLLNVEVPHQLGAFR